MIVLFCAAEIVACLEKIIKEEGAAVRLDKFLADCGIGTRSEVRKIIKIGEVNVVGTDKPKLDTHIDEKSAEVYVKGERISYVKNVYFMLNKPQNCLSATRDEKMPVVTDFVPDEYKHYEVFPVGRLDADTVGLCVLTNDGELAHRLLSPAKHIPKTYVAEVDGLLTDADIDEFKLGMDLGDFVAKPSKMKIISASCERSVAEVTIYEGKFHQIKRMFKKCGKTVTHLKRIAMNNLKLDESLKNGDIRQLTSEELRLLTDGIY